MKYVPECQEFIRMLKGEISEPALPAEFELHIRNNHVMIQTQFPNQVRLDFNANQFLAALVGNLNPNVQVQFLDSNYRQI